MNIIFNNTKPKYIELYEQIVRSINTNELKINTKLPSKRELSIELDVSINTIINAYDLLLEEGYIYSIEKKGYYVASNSITKVNNSILSTKKIESKVYKYDFTTQNTNEAIDTNFKKIIKEELDTNSYINKNEFKGDYNLRLAIANHLSANRGINANPDNIYITFGLEGIESLLSIIPIDNIALENPGYHRLAEIAKRMNKQPLYINIDNNGMMPIDSKAIIYTTSFNQFPTGIKMSISRKNELIKYASAFDTYIIEDDFDAEYRINTAPTTSIYSINPNRVIFFSSFSPTIFPGLKVSYFIIPDNLKNIYDIKYKGYSNPVNGLIQSSLAKYIDLGYYAKHINRKKRLFLEKRNIIIDFFKDKNDIEIDEKKNYVSMILKTNKDVSIIIDKCLKNNIKINSITNFDINNSNNDKLILGYTNIDKAIMNEALMELYKIIKEA